MVHRRVEPARAPIHKRPRLYRPDALPRPGGTQFNPHHGGLDLIAISAGRLEALYAWERRCRGYDLFGAPVEIEPAFVPFYPGLSAEDDESQKGTSRRQRNQNPRIIRLPLGILC